MTKSMLIMRPSDETGSNIEILEFDELLATFGQVHDVPRSEDETLTRIWNATRR